MNKFEFIILSTSLLTCDGFCSGFFNRLKTTVQYVSSAVVSCFNPYPEETQRVRSCLQHGYSYNIYTDNDRAVHLHNDFIPFDKAQRIETVVVWAPAKFWASSMLPDLPKLRRLILPESVSSVSLSDHLRNIEQLNVPSNVRSLNLRLDQSFKHVSLPLFASLDAGDLGYTTKAEVVLPNFSSEPTSTSLYYDLSDLSRNLGNINYVFSRRIPPFFTFMFGTSLKAENICNDIPFILLTPPFYAEHFDNQKADFKIDKMIDSDPSEFDEKNIWNNSESAIMKMLTDHPVKTLSLLQDVAHTRPEDLKNPLLKFIYTRVLYNQGKRDIPSILVDLNKPSLDIQILLDALTTDAGAAFLRRWYRPNDFIKAAVLLCSCAEASWSHLITHHLLQEDMDFIKTMLLLSAGFGNLSLDPVFPFNSNLVEIFRNDDSDQFSKIIGPCQNMFQIKICNNTLIAAACLFGSVKIFKYLLLNHAELTPDLWYFAISGGNAELIHILEQNNVPIDSLEHLMILAHTFQYDKIFQYLFEKRTKGWQKRFCNAAFLTHVFDSENQKHPEKTTEEEEGKNKENKESSNKANEADEIQEMQTFLKEFDFRYLGTSTINYFDLRQFEEDEEKNTSSSYHISDYADSILTITDIPEKLKDQLFHPENYDKSQALDLLQKYPNITLITFNSKDDKQAYIITNPTLSQAPIPTNLTLERARDLINYDGFLAFVKNILDGGKKYFKGEY